MNTDRDIRHDLFTDPDALHARLCSDLESMDKIRRMLKRERNSHHNQDFQAMLSKRITKLLDDRKRLANMIHLVKRVRTNKNTARSGSCEKTTAQHFVALCRKEMTDEHFERILREAVSASFDGKVDDWNRPDPTAGVYP